MSLIYNLAIGVVLLLGRNNGGSCYAFTTTSSTVSFTVPSHPNKVSSWRRSHHVALQAKTGGGGPVMMAPLPLYKIPLLGRFRKKKTIEQPKAIAVGDALPEIDVQVLERKQGSGSDDESTFDVHVMTIRDFMGNYTKALLVGMPGAFTPTCTGEHLPGYVKNSAKLQALGIEKVAIATTNDRFVNKEWAEAVGVFEAAAAAAAADDEDTKEDYVSIISDGDGDMVKNMGLAEDMGFGVGVRSKRFALVTENGMVTTLLSEDGMDVCSATSAESIVSLLSPEDVATSSDADDQNLAIAAVGLTVVAGAAAYFAAQGSP